MAPSFLPVLPSALKFPADSLRDYADHINNYKKIMTGMTGSGSWNQLEMQSFPATVLSVTSALLFMDDHVVRLDSGDSSL